MRSRDCRRSAPTWVASSTTANSATSSSVPVMEPLSKPRVGRRISTTRRYPGCHPCRCASSAGRSRSTRSKRRRVTAARTSLQRDLLEEGSDDDVETARTCCGDRGNLRTHASGLRWSAGGYGGHHVSLSDSKPGDTNGNYTGWSLVKP